MTAFLLAAMAAGLSLSPAAAQAQETADMEKVRAALAKYADPIVAVHDGYFSTLACIDFPGGGSAGRMQ
jgi:hypothetical protein